MSWAVGVSLCLLLPSLMIFPAARSLCDFPVFRALPLVSAESWEHGPIQLLWCDVPLPGFHLLPWKIPFLAGAKFPLLYFTFSFLLLLFPFYFLSACGLFASLSLRCFLFWLHLVAVPETVNCLGRDVSPWQRTRPQAHSRLLFLFVLLLSRLTNTYTQIHTNT